MTSSREAPVGQHLCQVYDDEHGLHAAVSEFVGAGLTSAELVVVVTGADADEVGSYLAGGGLDPGDALERGQLRVVALDGGTEGDARVGEVVDRVEAVLGTREPQGYTAVRMACDVDSLYGPESVPQMVAREQLGAELVRSHPLVALCLYHRRAHGTDFLLRAAAEHGAQVVPSTSDWYRDELVVITRGGTGTVRVTGQVDLYNRAAWTRSITALLRESRGDVVVDLSGTSFMDIGGLRVLVTSALAHPARRMVLLSPSAGIQHTLHVMSWDELPNLVVVGSDGQP